MVVDDLDIMSVPVVPHKAHAPLIIDPDRVPATIVLWSLQSRGHGNARHICVLCSTAMAASTTLTAERAIATLRDHAAELRQAGIRHVGLFGSLARGEANPACDIDLVVELDQAARIGVIRLAGIERRLAEILGGPVDVLPEPIEQPRIRANVDRDRRRVF
jgi:uncharacterized protein